MHTLISRRKQFFWVPTCRNVYFYDLRLQCEANLCMPQAKASIWLVKFYLFLVNISILNWIPCYASWQASGCCVLFTFPSRRLEIICVIISERNILIFWNNSSANMLNIDYSMGNVERDERRHFKNCGNFAFCLFTYPKQSSVLSGQIWEMRKIYFRHYDASMQVTAGSLVCRECLCA